MNRAEMDNEANRVGLVMTVTGGLYNFRRQGLGVEGDPWMGADVANVEGKQAGLNFLKGYAAAFDLLARPLVEAKVMAELIGKPVMHASVDTAPMHEQWLREHGRLLGILERTKTRHGRIGG